MEDTKLVYDNFLVESANEISFFNVNENKEPAMKICMDGKFYVNGKLVKEDIEVYNAFRRWLNGQGVYNGYKRM